MRVLGWIAALGVLLAATAAGGTKDSHPAVWLQHAVIVDLQNLPKRYSCDELWYKFRDVLLAIGARPDMKILPYGCEQRSGSPDFSPRVELTFSLPREVAANDARWADLQVMAKPVRLQPGAPSHLDDQDCDLLKQIKDTLLTNINYTVSGFHLACGAPRPSSGGPFGLTVEALVPVTQSSTHAAAAPSLNRRGPAGSGL
jgi:hypothetical protein